jgi:hypothetical protein
MEKVGRVVLLAACIEGLGQGATSVRKEVTSHCAERPSTYDPKEKMSVGGVLVNGGLDLQRQWEQMRRMVSKECGIGVDAHDCKELSGIPERKD